VSTPAIALPRSQPAASERLRSLARRALRGAPGDPVWSRPALIGVALLAGLLVLWGLTANGNANTYYASAVYAASHSWSAFFHDALDLSQYVSVDKTPLAIWMMALSARLFGYSSFSMLLPDALCGIGSVLLLHNVVRRTLGHRAAIAAAAILAVTPVAVVVARFNNPDALLVLLLIGAAWALVRAIESGRTRHIVLCGVLVGLAFNTKMLQAYLIVPALAITFLLAARGGVWRRARQLVAGGLAMATVSVAWVGLMMLIPAGQRPYVGDSTGNSWWQLIFGANGLDRVGSATGGGPGGAGGFGGSQGALRLFNSQLGGQIAWLLPLALVGLPVGLWVHRRGGRTDRARAAYVLWGVWALVHVVVFSFSLNLFHPYYASALAPAVAALAGGGLVELWSRWRRSSVAALLLAAAVFGTGVLAFVLLRRTPQFAPWLAWVVLAASSAFCVALIGSRLRGRISSRLALALASCGVVAVLAAPTAYSLATIGHSTTGSNPTAGPAGAGADFAGPPGAGRAGGPPPGALGRGGVFGPPPGAFAGGRPFGPPPGATGGGPGAGAAGAGAGRTVDRALIAYLEAHRGSTKYLVAANSSMTAAPILLATHQSVVTMGGFNGADPAPTVAQLKSLIHSGQLRYVLLGGGPGGGAGRGPGRGGSDAGAQARTTWVQSNCKSVNYSGSGSSGLYDCAAAA
jgi:4-amino-4-deoxy-L-arabinose transferase-like glycosyltransferase